MVVLFWIERKEMTATTKEKSCVCVRERDVRERERERERRQQQQASMHAIPTGRFLLRKEVDFM